MIRDVYICIDLINSNFFATSQTRNNQWELIVEIPVKYFKRNKKYILLNYMNARNISSDLQMKMINNLNHMTKLEE